MRGFRGPGIGSIPSIVSGITIGLTGLATFTGCQDRSPPPAPSRMVASPDRADRDVYVIEKPLPDQSRRDMPAPPFDDVPLVNQRPPEQRAYVDAYQHVGRPRILVFVNRTLDGELVTNRAEAGGYLRPGEYDAGFARSIDYQAIENVLTDWLSADGQVAILSPAAARLTDQQARDLQAGRAHVLGDVAAQSHADVLVQVQARPTRQSAEGIGMRLVAEAMNIRGGESIARAFVDVPPPLDKPQINKYTRFIARKLMDGMIGSWQSFGGPEDDRGRADPRPEPRSPDRPAPPIDDRAPRGPELQDRSAAPVPGRIEPATRPEPGPANPPDRDAGK